MPGFASDISRADERKYSTSMLPFFVMPGTCRRFIVDAVMVKVVEKRQSSGPPFLKGGGARGNAPAGLGPTGAPFLTALTIKRNGEYAEKDYPMCSGTRGNLFSPGTCIQNR